MKSWTCCIFVGGGTFGSKLYYISLDSVTREAEIYGHGEFGYPDWKVEGIPIFLDLRSQGFESGTVNVYCNVVWSSVGREDIHESLVDELRHGEGLEAHFQPIDITSYGRRDKLHLGCT